MGVQVQEMMVPPLEAGKQLVHAADTGLGNSIDSQEFLVACGPRVERYLHCCSIAGIGFSF
jgi:hypothetical protein